MDATLWAGASRIELHPDLGLPMMGYGARRGTALARHDPLYVRALHLAQGDAAVLLLEADFCLVGVSQATEVRERLAARTGLASEQILLGCIHTHSGPDTGLMQVVLGGEAPESVRPLYDTVVEAGAAAVADTVRARLATGRAPVAIGRNRRVAAGPVDPDVLVLRVDRVGGGPVAVLYIHGCHPTALGHDNLAYSADWPGKASRVVENALPGAVALFALGAHADVDPRTRGLLDLAIPNQSVGVSFDEMEVLGREVGEAVVACARSLEADLAEPAMGAVGAASVRVAVPTHGGDLAPDARTEWLESRRCEALAALGLEPDARPTTQDLYRLEVERTAGLPVTEVREKVSRIRVYLRDRTARRIAGGDVPDVEVQVLRLGPLWLLGLPLEVTVDVGAEWRERASRAGETAAVVSIANGWMRYLPHAAHFEERFAEQHYEILQSTFVPSAAERLLAAGEELQARILESGQASS